MYLTDRQIRSLAESMKTEGRELISPLPEDNAFQPCTVDLKLGDQVLIGQDPHENGGRFSQIDLKPNGILIPPGTFLLASTVETVDIPADILARVEGKSSLGREGLLVHVTAGLIDPGFRGTITLEIVNLSPWKFLLVPGMKICQLSLARLSEPVSRQYGDPSLGSKYRDQKGPTPAKKSPQH